MSPRLPGAHSTKNADMARVVKAVINNTPSVGKTGNPPEKPSGKPPVK